MTGTRRCLDTQMGPHRARCFLTVLKPVLDSLAAVRFSFFILSYSPFYFNFFF